MLPHVRVTVHTQLFFILQLNYIATRYNKLETQPLACRKNLVYYSRPIACSITNYVTDTILGDR